MPRKRGTSKAARDSRPNRKPKRASSPPPSTASHTDDDDVFIPPSFGVSKVETTTDDDDVFIPPSFGIEPPTVDLRDALDERLRELDGLGFDIHGNCKYGCGGSESPKVQGVGMHDVHCMYWHNEGRDKAPF
jgi:hypothetical protein